MLLRTILPRLAKDQTGATFVEYALIIGVISMTIVAAANSLLSSRGALWTFVLDNLATVW